MTMKTQRFAVSLFSLGVGLLAGAAPVAIAQSGSFTVSQHGQPVGTASYRIEAASGGFDSTSIVRISMEGLDYALSKTERLGPASQFRNVQVSGAVNGSAVTVSGAPEATQVVLTVSASGRSSTARLPLHPAAVFLPDFDPGALQTLLTLAAARNGRDLWAILPKQAGSVEPVTLATYTDEKGTLDGKAIVVHHLVATVASSATDLFSGPEGLLLQAELPQQGFALVRKGFVLTPPAKPQAPPGD
jgi:hypothetical protein